jgi:hypothetical protein
MLLEPADFNDFLGQMGQQVDWRVASACPCRHARSGAADTACGQCHGLGYYWSDPARCLVAISGQKTQAEWAKFGLWENGDQVVTLPSDSAAYAMGQFDRLTMVQSSIPFRVVLRPSDVLRDQVVIVDQATWFVGDTLVTANLPPEVGEDGVTLSWPGDQPPLGAQVALSGRKRPEYFCLQEFPQDRAHHGGRDLPRRVVLRRFDLLGRV